MFRQQCAEIVTVMIELYHTAVLGVDGQYVAIVTVEHSCEDAGFVEQSRVDLCQVLSRAAEQVQASTW